MGVKGLKEKKKQFPLTIDLSISSFTWNSQLEVEGHVLVSMGYVRIISCTNASFSLKVPDKFLVGFYSWPCGNLPLSSVHASYCKNV